MKKIISILLTTVGLSIQVFSQTAKYAGTYFYGGKNENDAYGLLQIYPETDSTILFYIENGKGAPSYNSGSIDGRALLVRKDSAIYSQNDSNCVLYIKFHANRIKVDVYEHHDGCGYGGGVSPYGEYLKINKSTPPYFINREGDTTYFAKTKYK